MKKVLLIDNYDSFTYNLMQYLAELGAEVLVRRNDKIRVMEALEMRPTHLVISPGPGTVEESSDIGIGADILTAFQGKIPILGVCLGHQLIAYLRQGKIQKVHPVHGKRWQMQILHREGIFVGLPESITGMRYHSLVANRQSLKGSGLRITAETADEEKLVMGIDCLEEKIFGIQFHPESIGTVAGKQILQNFLQID